jgi:hypothetical protein
MHISKGRMALRGAVNYTTWVSAYRDFTCFAQCRPFLHLLSLLNCKPS